MIEIRTAETADAERLLEIYGYYVRNTAISFEYETPSLGEFAGRMERTLEKYPYLVLVRDGKIEGYAYAGPFKDRAAYGWSCEISIYLDRNARKRGLGRMLSEALEQELKRMGILNLYGCIAYRKKRMNTSRQTVRIITGISVLKRSAYSAGSSFQIRSSILDTAL